MSASAEIWMQVQTESLGPVFDFTPDYAVYWSYVPHFVPLALLRLRLCLRGLPV
jgi:hypothetical protein